MAFDNDALERIFDRTDGHCHICRRKLAFTNYGQAGRRGAWELEHSNARANGGTDRLNNLYPAHITCNRSKGDRSSRSVRAEHGYRSAPLSAHAKQQNAMKGGLVGAALGFILVPPPLRIAAALFTAIAGAAIGSRNEPR